MTKPADTEWIAVDWGTTHCRAWAMSAQNVPLANASSAIGMAAVPSGQFESALLSLIENWLPGGGATGDRATLVLACGMVGARQGWSEVPYALIPCAPMQLDQAVTIPNTDPRIRVQLLPGLCQHSPADVMRGEETQLAGLLAQRPDFDGVVCMPGTHTKWVVLQDGRITYFKSWMTGELFSLLEQQSVLKHSLTEPGFDQRVFDQTVTESVADDAAPMGDLFRIRADSLLHGESSDAARARLSALVISNEVIAMRKFWAQRSVVVLGAQQLSRHYCQVLTSAGAQALSVDGDDLTLAGLCAARLALSEQESS